MAAFLTPLPLFRTATSQRPLIMERNPPNLTPETPPVTHATLASPPPAPTPAVPSDIPQAAPWIPAPATVHSIKTPEQFDHILQKATEQDTLFVADFMAAWCRKCIYLLPKFKKVAALHDNVYFCSVDVNKVQRLPKEYAIEKMPTFVFMKGGEKVRTVVGGGDGKKVAAQIEECIRGLLEQ